MDWIRRLFNRRLIFSYWDGSRTRYVDPVAIQRAIWDHPEYTTDRLKMLGNPLLSVEDRFEVHGQLLQVVRDVFGIAPFDDSRGKPSGLTLEETWHVWADFGNFSVDLKKKPSPWLTLRRLLGSLAGSRIGKRSASGTKRPGATSNARTPSLAQSG